jgi:acetylornithine deacetylase
VREPSVTGEERRMAELVAARAAELGLEATVVEHDLASLRAADGYPGEEAPRTELVGARVVLRGGDGPRLAIAAHIDVVNEGSEPWTHGPWSGAVDDGYLYGRGAVDMKAGLAAALHAMAAADPPSGDVVLLPVPSEEDGGLGAFAALEDDSDYGACFIPEPTGFELVCAQAGAVTFRGVVRGVAAHAALRLEGRSAIDRYVEVHGAIAALERRINDGVRHPLMTGHELPYPVLVGKVNGGRWSSQVPDELVFEGRLGVPIGRSLQEARSEFERVVGDDVEVTWTGGQFGSGETDPGHPFARLVSETAGSPPVTGVTWGADMRLFTDRGIPTVMYGTTGIERAHGVDERVAIADVERLQDVIARVIR